MDNTLEDLMQIAHECVLNTKDAIETYIDDENTDNKIFISLQLMNQAFQCAKQFQNKYFSIKKVKGLNCYAEQFYHQFLYVNKEFLDSLKIDHSLQHSLLELEKLEDFYNELKSNLG